MLSEGVNARENTLDSACYQSHVYYIRHICMCIYLYICACEIKTEGLVWPIHRNSRQNISSRPDALPLLFGWSGRAVVLSSTAARAATVYISQVITVEARLLQ